MNWASLSLGIDFLLASTGRPKSPPLDTPRRRMSVALCHNHSLWRKRVATAPAGAKSRRALAATGQRELAAASREERLLGLCYCHLGDLRLSRYDLLGCRIIRNPYHMYSRSSEPESTPRRRAQANTGI